MKLHSLSRKLIAAVASVAMLAAPLTAAPAEAAQNSVTQGWGKFH